MANPSRDLEVSPLTFLDDFIRASRQIAALLEASPFGQFLRQLNALHKSPCPTAKDVVSRTVCERWKQEAINQSRENEVLRQQNQLLRDHLHKA